MGLLALHAGRASSAPKDNFVCSDKNSVDYAPNVHTLPPPLEPMGRQGRRNTPIRARDDAIFVPSLHHSSSTAWLAATEGLNPSAKLHQGVIRRELGFQSLVARCNIGPPR